MTIPSKTRKTFTRNNFADHNYNYTHPSKTNINHEKILVIIQDLETGITQWHHLNQ